MSNVLARCVRGKTKANNMADIEEEISMQANLFLFFDRALVVQSVEHRAVTREVMSSTPVGPTLRVLK